MRAESALCVCARFSLISAPLSSQKTHTLVCCPSPCCNFQCRYAGFLRCWTQMGFICSSSFLPGTSRFRGKHKCFLSRSLPAEYESPLVSYSWGAFCAVRVRSLAVYTKKFTRAHRGSLPTPKQIMQVLIEQEKAGGSWRAARYLRFIFSLV